jgi:hypothetical protein
VERPDEDGRWSACLALRRLALASIDRVVCPRVVAGAAAFARRRVTLLRSRAGSALLCGPQCGGAQCRPRLLRSCTESCAAALRFWQPPRRLRDLVVHQAARTWKSVGPNSARDPASCHWRRGGHEGRGRFFSSMRSCGCGSTLPSPRCSCCAPCRAWAPRRGARAPRAPIGRATCQKFVSTRRATRAPSSLKLAASLASTDCSAPFSGAAARTQIAIGLGRWTRV